MTLFSVWSYLSALKLRVTFLSARCSADKNQLTVTSSYKGVDQVRIFKRKSGKEEEDEDEVENLGAIDELKKAKDVHDE